MAISQPRPSINQGHGTVLVVDSRAGAVSLDRPGQPRARHGAPVAREQAHGGNALA